MALKIVGSSPIIHPRKREDTLRYPLFFWIMGLERLAPVRTLVQKQSGGLFLGRGRVHGFQNAVRKDCGLKTITGFQGHPYGVSLFCGMDIGLREENHPAPVPGTGYG